MAISNGFFRIFDNYPCIDSSSSTSIEDILLKTDEHPNYARTLINDALVEQLIEPIKNNNPLGVLTYKQRYRITQKGIQVYQLCEDI
jgi:hypothetical protein